MGEFHPESAVRVPINHPCCSSGMSVLVEDAGESVVSADVQAGDLVRIGDRLGQCANGCGLAKRPMGAVLVVVLLELAQRVHEVTLVPDQDVVQKLVPAGLHPPFHDRVHARHPDSP
jgi:hypothetical protein